jgi:energy-converting hydrogenase Eha subunit E
MSPYVRKDIRRSITHPVLSAELRQLGSCLGFFTHGEDLFLGVFLAYHVVLPFVLL